MPQPPPDDGRVHFGCWVTLEDDDGKRHVYRIVGPDETDAHRGHISADSPMARALLGKRLDDEIVVRRPRGDLSAIIVAIHIEETNVD